MADYLVHFNPFHDKLGRFTFSKENANKSLYKSVKRDVKKGTFDPKKYSHNELVKNTVNKSDLRYLDESATKDQEYDKVVNQILGKYSNTKISSLKVNESYRKFVKNIVDETLKDETTRDRERDADKYFEEIVTKNGYHYTPFKEYIRRMADGIKINISNDNFSNDTIEKILDSNTKFEQKIPELKKDMRSFLQKDLKGVLSKEAISNLELDGIELFPNNLGVATYNGDNCSIDVYINTNTGEVKSASYND